MLDTLEALFELAQDDQNALQMSRYMRNLHSFYGIKAPERGEILKKVIAEHGLPTPADLPALLQNMWDKPQREWHYCGLEIADKVIKKCPVEALDWIESLIIQKSWWDTVDVLAPRLAGKVFLRFPEKIDTYTARWITSDNFWLQRSALIFQLSYKTKTDQARLFAYCELCKDSKEFFIQKAIGWALRQYARTAPQPVRDFVALTPLASLSKREAMKHLTFNI